MGLAWPSTLPRPLLDGYSTSPGNEIVRTDMESGEARTRRRSVSAPDNIKLSWLLDATQMSQFRAYWDAELAGGAAWCDMSIDVGNGIEQKAVRVIGQYTALRVSAAYWKVSCEAEARKLRSTIFDYLNLMGLPSLDLNFAATQSLDPVITSSRQPAPVVSFSRSSTATYIGADGLLKTADLNEPRFDYDPISHVCKGLLIEEARANLLVYSEQFDNAAWGKQQLASVSANASAAPDGSSSAEGLVPNTTLIGHYLEKNITGLTAATNYTLSTYFKRGACKVARLQAFGTGNATHGLTFDFDTKVVTFFSSAEYTSGGGVTTSYGVTDVGNGWYRAWVSGFPDTAATNRLCRTLLTDATGATSFAGDGVTPAIYMWGAQLEAGAFPTSYIPTTSSSVTRAADVASLTGANFSNWYRQDEGAFVVSGFVSTAGGASARAFFSADNGTASERHQVRFNGTSAISTICVSGNIVYATPGAVPGTFTLNSLHRTAYTYKVNEVNAAMDGVAFTQDTSAIMPIVSGLSIGLGVGVSPLNGHVSRLQFFPRHVNDATLQALSA